MVKHFKLFFSETTSPILMKLCMKHEKPKPLIICANYDPRLTFTFLGQGQILELRLYIENSDIDGFFGIYCTL